MKRIGEWRIVGSRCAVLLALLALALVPCSRASVSPVFDSFAQDTQGNTELEHLITGMVKSGTMPLPGASISAANTLTGKKVVSSTDVDGTFSLTVPSTGRYVVRVELAAFAVATKEVVLNAATPSAKLEMELTLLSRVATPEKPQQATARIASATQGVQRLEVTEDASIADATASGSHGQADAPLPGMPALGTSSDATNESVAITGAMGNTPDWARNGDDIRDRIQEMRDRGDLPMGDGGRMLVLGGPGGGGGFRMRGGPGGGQGGMMRGFNVNRPHGSIFYSMGNSALDAAPYSLSGTPADKPDYGSSRFGATIGGPLNIPKIYNGGSKTFFFLNLAGTRATSPYDVFSTVPTLAERGGDFSAFLPTQSGPITSCNQALSAADIKAGNFILCNRATGQPFANNTIPAIDPAAQALLKYIPAPNLSGAAQNFRYSTSGETNGLNLSGRLIHNFGDVQPRGRGNRGGGRGRNRNNVNFGFNYSSNNADLLRAFPTVGGTTKTQSWNVNGGDTWSRGHWTNQLRANFNQNHTETTNQFAGLLNVAGLAGITGVSQNPQDWGVPSLSFSHFTGLNDVSPLARRDRVFQITDTLIWNHGKHTFRFGGDFRRLYTQLHNSANSRGTFTFTGYATAAFGSDGRPLPGTGYDLADFLLGAAQQTAIQYSPYTYNFAANGWDLFVQDAWRLRSNLSFDLGLRYEYISPYTEAKDRLVNLDVAPGFTSVATVQPDGTGPYSGAFPASLVKPDRNNFAPRIGLAWKPRGNTVVRAGYGVNYNLGQYKSIVQQLAFQPPFSYTATNIASPLLPLTLGNGFPAVAPSVLTNNYGIDPNYVLGYVQMWNLNIQQELTKSLVLNVGYNGSKGTALDIVRAPNRGPLGLRIADVQSFLWESSQGDSILHAGSVRLNKRMTKGLSVGATYVFSKSIDNASSIGGGATVVAQNDLDLAAERGLSSFDQRHRLTGNWVYELPFGTGKEWFAKGGTLGRIIGDWTWSGSFTVASGTPWTARVIGDFADVARGSNGSLRADYTGLPIALADPTLGEWFNTAAFTVPAHGQFGDAGRNTIIGPGSMIFNMSLGKSFPMKDMMGFELRLQANNIFNTPQYTAIDTVVNSPTFGRVLTVGSMRKMQVVARFRF